MIIRLIPSLKEYIWGGNKLRDMYRRDNGENKISESWELSVHPDGKSRCDDGKPLEEYLLAHPQAVNAEGDPLPVLVKYIDAAQKLSVQVHPDDAYAHRFEQDNGKTELWYVIQADEGAGIYCGFRKDTDRAEFMRRIRDGTVEECLNRIPARTGDAHLIKAGTVHAIGAGCVICEIQRSSNVTYRVYDYNRAGADGKPRALHIQKAMDVIDFSAYRDETGCGAWQNVSGGKMRLLTECEYFRCRELRLEGDYSEDAERSFIAVNAIEGCGCVNGLPFRAGDSFFLPYRDRLSLNGRAKLLLTDLPASPDEK